MFILFPNSCGRRTLDVRKQLLVLGRVGDEALDSAANHGVLAHKDNRLASQGAADFVHLLRRDTAPFVSFADSVEEEGTYLSTPTMKTDLYSSSKPLSLSK